MGTKVVAVARMNASLTASGGASAAFLFMARMSHSPCSEGNVPPKSGVATIVTARKKPVPKNTRVIVNSFPFGLRKSYSQSDPEDRLPHPQPHRRRRHTEARGRPRALRFPPARLGPNPAVV